jgi:hypothetical protein
MSGGGKMINEDQKRWVLEILSDLESQINAGEYYSYDSVVFVENVREAERLFGVTYVFDDDKWHGVDGEIKHKADSLFRGY